MQTTIMFRILPLFLLAQLLTPQQVVNGCEQEAVYVVNALSDPLKVHCEFGGQDLGATTLNRGQDFHWFFCDSNQGKTMTCQLFWGSKNVAFAAFKESGKNIAQTFWTARTDGIYLKDSVGDQSFVRWSG